jgi:hypothetical protein
VGRGEPLAEVHALTVDAAAGAALELAIAYELADEPPPERPVVLDLLA